MVNLKDISNRFLVISYLVRVLAILGCLLFLISSIFPFYRTVLGTMDSATISQLWSFKNDSQTLFGPFMVSTRNQLWFFDYWIAHTNSNLSDAGIPWVLPLLFAIQVLTSAFGVASVIFRKRILSFAPILLSSTVISFMIYMNWVFAAALARGILYFDNSEFLFITSARYQLGYYLVYLSLVMFLSAFALNEVTKKRQTIEPAKENLNTLSSSLKD